MSSSLKTNKSVKIAKKTEEEDVVKFYKMLSTVIIKKDGKNKNEPIEAPETDSISKEDKDKDELIEADFIYTTDKIRQHDPYFFKYYINENNNQFGIKELLHEAENAIKVSEITNDNDAIALVNQAIKVEYDIIRTSITIKEALNCLKLRDRANITQKIQEIDDFKCLNYNGTEYAINYNDNSNNYIKLKIFNLIQNVVKWLNFKIRKTPHFEESALESIRTGIGIQICLKDFRLLNGLEDKIREFIHQRNDDYHIIIFQFSNFLFYYLKNIFEYAIGEPIKDGYDEDFDHENPDKATNIKWIGYATRDKYPKNKNHSKKRPVPVKDGIYSMTNNYAFKFEEDYIKDIHEKTDNLPEENVDIQEENVDIQGKKFDIYKKRILLITDSNHTFNSDFDAFKINVLFYDFKNPFDFFLNNVMENLLYTVRDT
ncbi:13121_t:CDS:1 [Cetraspora pellucida]|uniref:13121_t:CDS:1 n=1 Tax=Cetraspora pellucida TaxID=1433469 RepID=A0A9N9N7X1_9GLOM|nr:13121_t:CDS:1 [Cetraspora pellucida]